MLYEVKLPKLGDKGNGPETATVVFWLVEEDDDVKQDDDLVELQTDKAAFTVQAPKAGTLIEKLVLEDDEVLVGDVLCLIEI